MRVSKKETPEQLFKAIKKEFEVTVDSCLGKEYSPEVPECRMCGMRNVCMVLTAKTLEEYAENKFKSLSPFVDTIDWTLVPVEKLVKMINQQPVSIVELRQVFEYYSNCKDPVTVAMKVNSFIKTNNFKLKDTFVTV